MDLIVNPSRRDITVDPVSPNIPHARALDKTFLCLNNTAISYAVKETMKFATISIPEGKKGFSRLIDDALKKREDVIVTKRGKPVVVMVPYDEYQRSRRISKTIFLKKE